MSDIDKTLVRLVDEASQVIHKVMQIQKYGLYDNDNDVRLEKKVGNLLAAVHILKREGLFNEEVLYALMRDKLETWNE